jgi:hypothetical protein
MRMLEVVAKILQKMFSKSLKISVLAKSSKNTKQLNLNFTRAQHKLHLILQNISKQRKTLKFSHFTSKG